MLREYELLEDASVIRRFDKSRFPPNGVAGGGEGGAAGFVINPGTDKEQVVRASGRFELKAGDRILLKSAGGGGFGDPHERDRDALARDVAEGRISQNAARTLYGAKD